MSQNKFVNWIKKCVSTQPCLSNCISLLHTAQSVKHIFQEFHAESRISFRTLKNLFKMLNWTEVCHNLFLCLKIHVNICTHSALKLIVGYAQSFTFKSYLSLHNIWYYFSNNSTDESLYYFSVINDLCHL